MKKISKRFNWLLIISICISVILSSLLTTGLMIARSRSEIHERNLIQAKSLSDNLESFFANVCCLNYQLSINPIIANNIIKSEDDWETRKKLYSEMYGFTENEIRGIPLLVSMAEQYTCGNNWYGY